MTDYDALYSQARWRQLRKRFIREREAECNRCKRLLGGSGNAPNAPVVHHITRHKGDLELFYDESNLELVCKQCHDGPIQSYEKQSDRGWYTDEEGWLIRKRR